MAAARNLLFFATTLLGACGPGGGGGAGMDPAGGDEWTDPPASEESCGNGLDDDRDGPIDEGCSCEPGSTQPCFEGPPEQAGAGCPWGTQRCAGDEEFGSWGPCEGQAACEAPPPPDEPPPPPDDPPPNASCTTAIDVTPGGPGVTREVNGTTCGAANLARLICSDRAAPEVYYVWTSPDEAYAVSWTITPGFAVGLAQAEESCEPGPFDCESEDSWFDAHTHTLVVERRDADCGPFTLRVTRDF